MLRRMAPIVAAGAASVYWLSEVYVMSGRPAYPLDDAWIHLQFAKNLAAGEGLAFHAGTWVTGSTSPLWSALLAIGFLVPGAFALVWPKLLGVGLFALTVAGSGRLAKELGLPEGWSSAVAWWTALSHWLIWSALSGMEVPLFTCLAVWGMVFHLRELDRERASPRSLVLLSAAVLARPEGALLWLLAVTERIGRWWRESAADRSRDEAAGSTDVSPGESSSELFWRFDWQRRGEVVWGVCLSALIVLPTLFFYRWVGGSFLPSTFAAKTQAASLVSWPDGRYLRVVLDIFLRSQPVLTLLAAAGAVALWARPKAVPRLVTSVSLLPALWLLGQTLVYSMLAGDGGALPVGNFGRYYFPLLPMVIVLGFLGLKTALAGVTNLRMGRRRVGLASIMLLVLLIPQIRLLALGPVRYLRNVANVEDTDVQAARWLSERLPAAAIIAAQDIGALKFLLPNRILDLAGIVQPQVLPFLLGQQGGHAYWEQNLAVYLQQTKADFLVIFASSYPMLNSADGFQRVQSFAIDDNVTMAGSELVILRTPWSRYSISDAAEP